MYPYNSRPSKLLVFDRLTLTWSLTGWEESARPPEDGTHAEDRRWL